MCAIMITLDGIAQKRADAKGTSELEAMMAGCSMLKKQLADAEGKNRTLEKCLMDLQSQSEGDQNASVVRIAMYTQKRTFDSTYTGTHTYLQAHESKLRTVTISDG